MGDVVRERLDVLCGQRLSGHGHAAIHVGTSLGLEGSELFYQVLVMLPREARNVLLPNQPRGMAGITVVCLDKSLTRFGLYRITGTMRYRGRLRRIVGGKILHVRIIQADDERCHLRIRTLLLLEEEELIIGIERRLTGQGGDGRVRGVAVGAVTRSADLGLAPPSLDLRGATYHCTAQRCQHTDAAHETQHFYAFALDRVSASPEAASGHHSLSLLRLYEVDTAAFSAGT